MGRKSKNNDDKKAKVHKELEGFDIKINENGEVESNISIDELNTFLDKHVDDKKFRDVEVKRKKKK